MISIHALRVEGDFSEMTKMYKNYDFYPRPPGGGRHRKFRLIRSEFDFYPRPPGGGRRKVSTGRSSSISISIHALRVEGDGVSLYLFHPTPLISIHALRVEGDGFGEPIVNKVQWISIHALRVEGD